MAYGHAIDQDNMQGMSLLELQEYIRKYGLNQDPNQGDPWDEIRNTGTRSDYMYGELPWGGQRGGVETQGAFDWDNQMQGNPNPWIGNQNKGTMGMNPKLQDLKMAQMMLNRQQMPIFGGIGGQSQPSREPWMNTDEGDTGGSY